MIIAISLVSFSLDMALTKYVSLNSLFVPLFTMISLIIIYPYFNHNYRRYYRYIAILGLLYDIAYANMLFYNFFIFMLLGFVIIFIQYLLSYHLYTSILSAVIVINIYRLVNFVYANIVGNVSMYELFKSIYSSLIINITYCVALHMISEYFSNKYKILKSK